MRPIRGGRRSRANLPQDVRNMAAEEATASFDHRHRFVGSVTYALPNLSAAWTADGRLKLGSDWQVNGIVTARVGRAVYGQHGNRPGEHRRRPGAAPRHDCDPNEGGAKTSQQWFNTSCFALQPQFTFGNAPRNSVLAPGYASVDARPAEGYRSRCAATRLQFRWEIFNLLNRVNFDVPNRMAFTPNFGRIFSAKPPGRCSSASRSCSDLGLRARSCGDFHQQRKMVRRFLQRRVISDHLAALQRSLERLRHEPVVEPHVWVPRR